MVPGVVPVRGKRLEKVEPKEKDSEMMLVFGIVPEMMTPAWDNP